MNVKNYLRERLTDLPNCHDGEGILGHITLYDAPEFKTKLKFINYTVLSPGTSIGLHRHGDDEEIYIVLEGMGLMTVDQESQAVTAGDVIVNKPYGSHGIVNDGEQDLKLLVFEVAV